MKNVKLFEEFLNKKKNIHIEMNSLYNFEQWLNESFMSAWNNFWDFGKMPNSQWLKDEQEKIVNVIKEILSSSSKEYDINVEFKNVHGDYEVRRWSEYKTAPRSTGELKDITTILIYDSDGGKGRDPKLVIDLEKHRIKVGTAFINVTKKDTDVIFGDLVFLINNEKEIKEDFAAVGTPPSGNVSGMGAVVPPAPGSVGSGDTWPSLGAPAVSIPINSGFCAKCKKPKKACKCEDSPSQKAKRKHKKTQENLKHMSSYADFLNEENGELEITDYKGVDIFHSPHTPDEWYVNDETFDSLENAKKYIDDGAKPSAKTINAYRHGAM